MHRIAIEFVQPGMTLARDVYDQDGTIMVSAGIQLSAGILLRLRSRGILSIYIQNPKIELPVLSTDVTKSALIETRTMVEQAFNTIRQAGRILLSDAEDQLVHEVVSSALDNPAAVIHTAHIQRHSCDLMSHSVQVALLATVTGVTMGLNDRPTLYEIATGSLLHDIGKVLIPADLLKRTEALSPEEEMLYREHTRWGYAILCKASDLPTAVARVALEHHEHVDGSGYPENLDHDAMSPASRIVAVANAYERIFSEVSARAGNSFHLAYESIMSGAGTAFDLEPARALLSQVPMYPNGTIVELTTGFIGTVVTSQQSSRHRPVIEIIQNPQGLTVDPPFLLDLSSKAHQSIFVKSVVDDERAARILSA